MAFTPFQLPSIFQVRQVCKRTECRWRFSIWPDEIFIFYVLKLISSPSTPKHPMFSTWRYLQVTFKYNITLTCWHVDFFFSTGWHHLIQRNNSETARLCLGSGGNYWRTMDFFLAQNFLNSFPKNKTQTSNDHILWPSVTIRLIVWLEKSMICRLTMSFSHMGAFTLSVSLLLHLGLHLGDHLLHSSQLWNTRNPHVWQIQRSHTQRSHLYHQGLQCLCPTSASFSSRIMSLSISSGSGPFLDRWKKTNKLPSCYEPKR